MNPRNYTTSDTYVNHMTFTNPGGSMSPGRFPNPRGFTSPGSFTNTNLKDYVGSEHFMILRVSVTQRILTRLGLFTSSVFLIRSVLSTTFEPSTILGNFLTPGSSTNPRFYPNHGRITILRVYRRPGHLMVSETSTIPKWFTNPRS